MDFRRRIETFVTPALLFLVAAFAVFAVSDNFAFEFPPVANAQESEGIMNRMFAPGPLMEGHKQLEGKDCLKCHDAGKGIGQGLCLDCHKEIKVFVEAKKGFHGLATKSCIECHSDHKGRNFDSTIVDKKTFDHKQTGYILEGKHAEIDCVKCHETKRIKKPIRPNDTRYLGKQTSCVSCHKKDDIHFFSGKYAKKDCNECHGLKEWKTDLKFEHKRDTGYELRGKHAEMKCADCHGGGKEKKRVVYKWPQLKTAQCLSCHQDQHKGNFSKKFQNGRCTDCHTETEWKIPNFDHKITGYPLRGKHAELNCTECHKQTPAIAAKKPGFHKFTGLSKNCLSCHDDEHRFGNFKSARYKTPNNCLACHNESHWKKDLRFEHNLHSRFAINGRHAEVSCEECHLQQMPLKLEKSTDGDRSSKKSADISLSPFVGRGRSPAQAGEEKTPAFQKLKVGVYHWNQLQTKTCEVCHGNPHLGQFSKKQLAKKCTDCHTTEGWHLQKGGKKFDHSATRFPLDGAHTNVRCTDCHEKDGKKIYKFQNFEQKFCNECHATPHREQFSAKFTNPKSEESACINCHKTSKWTDRLPFDHNQTKYPLEGAHSKIECLECHTPTEQRFSTPSKSIKNKYLFPNLEEAKCLTCHRDVHKGQLGKTCTECHSEMKWTPANFNHNKQSEFKLRHKHVEVKCAECHKAVPGHSVEEGKRTIATIRYKPMSGECNSCHKDVHRGEFGDRCSNCHIEKGWKVTRDFHRNFTLKGVHFTMDCNECHRDGRKLAGQSQNCNQCHQKDDVHGGMLPNCGDCHRQHFWESTQFHHSRTRFPLRGVHRTLECADCHRGNVMQGLSSDCLSCHQTESTHHGNPLPAQFMDCKQCHHTFTFTR